MSVVVLIGTFFSLFILGERQSFWLDELDWTIGKVDGESFGNITQVLASDAFNLPLYYYVFAVFHRINPHSDIWLRVPSFLFLVVGLIFIKRYGDRYFGREIGFLALCIGAVSYFLLYQGGMQIRPYSILFCFSATMLLYHCRRREKFLYTNEIIFALSMVLLLYSHWFGALLVSYYFLIDLLAWYQKKLDIRAMWSYIVSIALFLPWLVLVYARHTSDMGVYWANVPNLTNAIKLASQIFGAEQGNSILLNLSVVAMPGTFFAIGVFFIVSRWLQKKRKQESEYDYRWTGKLLAIVYVFTIVYVHGKYINPSGSIFVPRYFFIILPQIFLIVSFGILQVKKMVSLSRCAIAALSICIVSSGLANYFSLYKNVTLIKYPYKETAQHLSGMPEIYNPSTIVVNSSGRVWIRHYFDQKGLTRPQNVATIYGNQLMLYVKDGEHIDWTFVENDFLYRYDRVVLFRVHRDFEQDFMDTALYPFEKITKHETLHVSVYERKH
jgi:uncharacterized membrane protein